MKGPLALGLLLASCSACDISGRLCHFTYIGYGLTAPCDTMYSGPDLAPPSSTSEYDTTCYVGAEYNGPWKGSTLLSCPVHPGCAPLENPLGLASGSTVGMIASQPATNVSFTGGGACTGAYCCYCLYTSAPPLPPSVPPRAPPPFAPPLPPSPPPLPPAAPPPSLPRPQNCPWLAHDGAEVTTEESLIIECFDGHRCDLSADGTRCCICHGGTAKCQVGYAMSKFKSCAGGLDYCCYTAVILEDHPDERRSCTNETGPVVRPSGDCTPHPPSPPPPAAPPPAPPAPPWAPAPPLAPDERLVETEVALREALADISVQRVSLRAFSSPFTLSAPLHLNRSVEVVMVDEGSLFVFDAGQTTQRSPRAVITVAAGANVTLKGLMITRGAALPCIHYQSAQASTREDTSTIQAAGIDNAGRLVMHRCRVERNLGTGVRNTGHLVLSFTTVEANTGAWVGGGVANFGRLFLQSSHVTHNAACYRGGGIFHGASEEGGRLTIVNSSVASNRGYSGAGIFVSTSYLNHSTARASLEPALDRALQASAAQLAAEQAPVLGDEAANLFGFGAPGAYESAATLTAVDSLLADNIAEYVGGGANLRHASALLVRTAVLRNAANLGGGLCLPIGAVVLATHSRVQGNRADSEGGGCLVYEESSLVLYASHVVENAVTSMDGGGKGGGISGFRDVSTMLDARASVIVNNSASVGAQLYNALGTVVLRDRTLVDGTAEGGDGIFNGNLLHYVLPAPLGHYLPATFTCRELLCPTPDGTVRPCPRQRCDAAKFAGKSMSESSQGGQPTPYPPKCHLGAYGGQLSAAQQSTADCSGSCPKSFYCPAAGTVTPIRMRSYPNGLPNERPPLMNAPPYPPPPPPPQS